MAAIPSASVAQQAKRSWPLANVTAKGVGLAENGYAN